MYSDLTRTVLLGGDEEQLDLEIRRIIEKHPDADRYEVADRLVSRAMARCAAVGAIASIPAGVLAGLPAAADMAFQVKTLHRLALGIARARRQETTAVDRAVAAVGVTVISIWPSRRPNLASTRPPSLVNFTALESRFQITCCTRLVSPKMMLYGSSITTCKAIFFASAVGRMTSIAA
jgi:hypothetical protein